MRFFIALVLWLILFVMCWPLAIVGVFIFAVLWLILLPFKVLGFTFKVLNELVKGIISLPFTIANAVAGR